MRIKISLILILQVLLNLLNSRCCWSDLNLYIAKENLKSDLNLDFDSDIYIVNDGKPASLLSNPNAFKGLIAPLPPSINKLKFKWRAHPLTNKGGVRYAMHLASSDEELMQVPTINIPKKALVPWYDHNGRGFQINFPCSGLKDGITDLTFHLNYTTVGSGVFENLKIVVRRQCLKTLSLRNSTVQKQNFVTEHSMDDDNWTRNLIIGLVCTFALLFGMFGGCFVYCYVQKRNRKLQMKFDYDYELKMKQREDELMRRSTPKKEVSLDINEQENLLNEESTKPIFILKRNKDYHRKWKKYRRQRQFRFGDNGAPPPVYTSVAQDSWSANRGLEKIPEEECDSNFERSQDVVENIYSENNFSLSKSSSMESIDTSSSGYSTADSSTLKSGYTPVDNTSDHQQTSSKHCTLNIQKFAKKSYSHKFSNSLDNQGFFSSPKTSYKSYKVQENPPTVTKEAAKDERRSYAAENMEELYRYMNDKWRVQFSDCVLTMQQVIIDNHPIGKGAYGRVHRGKAKSLDRDNPFKMTTVAIKIINPTTDFEIITSFVSEALLMKSMKHENIMNLLGVVLQPAQPPLLVSPFMKHTDLNQFLRSSRATPRRHQNLSSRQLIDFGVQIACGMKYLSELRYVHRDLNTRNCMVNERFIIKISDFSLARDISKENYKMNKKTRLPIKWMAIESLTDYIFSEKTDVWSFGVVLWELMTLGKQPYSGLNNQDVEKHLLDGKRLPQPQNCPDEIYNIMSSCWLELPEPRPNFTNLHQRLSEYEAKYKKYTLDYTIPSLSQIT
ncbi:tyrosine-protein kinase HCK-like [Hydractinia symbiolongicarpus]|uniref:tyrosine-protein kinase HCK-like n=1 Tax=Hydractinia symbiolongicarpus TaxID=13093 RepID=UPI00254BA418|nr:tyrosine-protein kinase HCK-like [Hydractinia symbiolongicarpus]